MKLSLKVQKYAFQNYNYVIKYFNCLQSDAVNTVKYSDRSYIPFFSLQYIIWQINLSWEVYWISKLKLAILEIDLHFCIESYMKKSCKMELVCFLILSLQLFVGLDGKFGFILFFFFYIFIYIFICLFVYFPTERYMLLMIFCFW